mmetsp:Transcript_12370/g.24940  ORF Transcript_12370/g.24940 Transcript_12370/m.24940 type:complete len:340 (+) Transcript_12370:25-1044(+)
MLMSTMRAITPYILHHRRRLCKPLTNTSSSAPFSSSQGQNDNDHPPDSSTVVQGPSLLTSTGVHRPSPSMFHLPGLRSLPFWTAPDSIDSGNESQKNRRLRVAYNDPTITSAVQHVESNFQSIRDEYFSAVLGLGNGVRTESDHVLKPLEPDYDVASKGGEHAEDALHSGTWDWHSYILNGNRNDKFADRCPKTAQVLDELEKEGMLFGTPFSFCFFSTLHGKSSIRPHTGPMNLRLRMHLPLMVPNVSEEKIPLSSTNNTRPVTGIRVADQVREWKEGSAVVLDDSYVHEVWNDSEETRVLLLLDLWHPDVKAVERESISNMFDYARDKGWIGGGKRE